ncbi:MAG: hypothetical protein ACKO63_18115 [Nodosilinea sp.]
MPGIPEYWIVDPTDSVILVLSLYQGLYQETRSISGEAYLESEQVGRLQITAAQVFAAIS